MEDLHDYNSRVWNRLVEAGVIPHHGVSTMEWFRIVAEYYSIKMLRVAEASKGRHKGHFGQFNSNFLEALENELLERFLLKKKKRKLP